VIYEVSRDATKENQRCEGNTALIFLIRGIFLEGVARWGAPGVSMKKLYH